MAELMRNNRNDGFDIEIDDPGRKKHESPIISCCRKMSWRVVNLWIDEKRNAIESPESKPGLWTIGGKDILNRMKMRQENRRNHFFARYSQHVAIAFPSFV